MKNDRLEALVYGSVLALIVGWVLYIGKSVFVPIVFSVLVVYVIVGLTRVLSRIPGVGRLLPVQMRYALSVLVSSEFAGTRPIAVFLSQSGRL